MACEENQGREESRGRGKSGEEIEKHVTEEALMSDARERMLPEEGG